MLETLLTVLVPLLLGIAATYYYSNRKGLTCIAIERRVLSPLNHIHPDVKVYFQDEKIDSLSEWTVAIWNSGNQTLQREDISGTLNLFLGTGRILKETLPVSSRPSTDPTLSVSENVINVCFNYLDRSDGIAFNAYVSPEIGLDQRVVFTGDIKGLPRGPRVRRNLTVPNRAHLVAVMTMFVVLSNALGFLVLNVISMGHELGLWSLSQNIVDPFDDFPPSKFLLCILFILVILLSSMIIALVWDASRWFVRTPRWIREKLALGNHVSSVHKVR